MKLILFAHPQFLLSQSMNKYAGMLAEGMKARGHEVETWQPAPVFFKLPAPGSLKKWLGYIDQYVLFPVQVRRRMRRLPAQALFVFTDHALGPWVPLASKRRHVIHCHDFLAQRSAMGEIKENPVSVTGKIYQNYIKRGYRTGKNFISISERTRQDLHRFLTARPVMSEVVYNGMNQPFEPLETEKAREAFGQETGIDVSAGYLLHIGGNQWYKNREGVIAIYNALHNVMPAAPPLLMVGASPSTKLLAMQKVSSAKNHIHFLTNIKDGWLNAAYAGASALVFPSLAEGFGWPIVEAMASGCPVLTTNDAPMTEIAGDDALLLDKMPVADQQAIDQWAARGAVLLKNMLMENTESRQQKKMRALKNAARFNVKQKMDEIEMIYQKICSAN